MTPFRGLEHVAARVVAVLEAVQVRGRVVIVPALVDNATEAVQAGVLVAGLASESRAVRGRRPSRVLSPPSRQDAPLQSSNLQPRGSRPLAVPQPARKPLTAQNKRKMMPLLRKGWRASSWFSGCYTKKASRSVAVSGAPAAGNGRGNPRIHMCAGYVFLAGQRDIYVIY